MNLRFIGLLCGLVFLAFKIEGNVQNQTDSELPSPEIILAADPGFDGQIHMFSSADREKERERMVREQIVARGVRDERTLNAIRLVPRHKFVPITFRKFAYTDRALPIGNGQTISQPYIVGRMTELLEIKPDDRVLEVGTGSGYQATIASLLAKEVVSIEIIENLAKNAAAKIESLGIKNLSVLYGDGYFGYQQGAPYDAIIVTAAAEHIPPPLVAQLKPGGKMVIPVGTQAWTQNLILLEKDIDGNVSTQNILAVRFVPLTRME